MRQPFRLFFLTLSLLAVFWGRIYAQSEQPLVLVLQADGPITPPMLEYLQRGLRLAEQQQAEAIIIQLNTPGGDLGTTTDIIQAFRNSRIPVIMYVAPNGSMAGSAGAILTMAAHAAAMAPETAIGAASPISSTGEDLTKTLETKAKEIMKATIRPLVQPRGPKAVKLAEAMIDEARAVSAEEAKDAGLIDFIASDVPDLLQKLDGFTVNTAAGSHTLHTANAQTQPIGFSLIEQLLLMLTDPNISFLLLAIGVQAILIEISSPGGWVAGFIGVVCLALATYGMGVLPVNWFGLVFLILAFVLFVLDIKAPTHGALTAAGVASFIVGALVLFNSPGTPQFQRVSPALVIGVGIFLGLIFGMILIFALRAQHMPIRMGMETLIGKTGYAQSDFGLTGQVRVESELWTAEPAEGSAAIRKGDRIEVVQIEGVRLKVRKV
ncbi:MAG: NfeD family protein [Anaerolineae bacterium]